MKHIADIQIKNAAHIFLDDHFYLLNQIHVMLQIATFLAIGPQIYVDGLVVVTDDDRGQRTRPIGRISSKHIISKILESNYPDCLETKASQIMDSTAEALEMDSTLSSALEVFDKTRFAFVPIVANGDNERKGEVDSRPIGSDSSTCNKRYSTANH